MGIGTIVGILAFVVVLGGFVVLGMNPNLIFENIEKPIIPTKTQSNLNLENIEQKLLSVESEEELTEIVEELMTSPFVLQECAELYKKVEESIKTTDFNDQKSIKNSLKLQKEFTETFCLSVKDQWYKP